MSKFRAFLPAAAVVLLLLVHFLPLAARPDPAAPVPADPATRSGALGNGLRYYIRPGRMPAGRVELRLVVKAGSLQEDEDQRGLAHFVEHMAFNGSTHFDRLQLVSYLQSIGLRFGDDVTANTSYDRTVYQLSVPTGERRNVDTAFTVLEDWAHGVRFDADAIEKERPILLDEANMRDSADARIERQLTPRLYNGSRHAEREPIGLADVIAHAPPEAIRRFYRDWYRPDLMAVVVAGDIAPDEAERQIRAHFGALANPRPERPHLDAVVPPDAGSAALVATDPEASASSVTVRYAVQAAAPLASIGVYRARLLDGLLAQLLGERLQSLSRRPDAPLSAPRAGVSWLTPRYRTFGMLAMLNGGGADAALAALVQTAAQARRYGFTAAELQRARIDTLRRYDRLYAARAGIPSAAYANDYADHFVNGEPLPGIENDVRLSTALLAEVTLDQVNAWARANIPSGGPRLVIYRGGDGPGKPDGARLMAALEAAERAPVRARAGDGEARQLMRMPPAPGRVVARSYLPKLRMTRLTLSNGVKVQLMPNPYQHGWIVLGGIREGGAARFAPQDLASARYGDAVAAAMGAGELSPVELRRSLGNAQVSFDTGMRLFADTVQGWCGASRPEFETLLQRVWLRFGHVRRDRALFDAFVQHERRAATFEADPALQLTRAEDDVLYGTSPYARDLDRRADVDAIDFDRSLALDRERFASAAGFTFVLAGDFDVNDAIPLLETYLGSLPAAPRAPAPARDTGLHPIQGVIKREVRAGGQGGVRIVFSGRADGCTEEEAVRLDALAETLRLRIVDVLRGKLGLVYAGTVSTTLYKRPFPRYTIELSLPTVPEHVEQLRGAALAELENLRREGPAEAELAKVKLALDAQYRSQIARDDFWVSHIEDAIYNGADPADALDYGADAALLTTRDVWKSARRYLDMDNHLEIVLAPKTTQARPSLHLL